MDMKTMQVDGGTLALDVRGDGPLVVCSPGMGDRRDAFHPLADRLAAAGFRVACVDLRGHGGSSTGFDRHGDEATADDLVAAIEALGGGPAVLAGASMSAAAATIAASRRPDLVSGLVLLGPFLRNAGGTAARLLMRALLARPWGPGVWRSHAASLWPGLGRDAARARAAELTDAQSTGDRWRAFRATARTDHAVVEPHLDAIRVPSLVVMGDADPDWRDPLAEAAWIRDRIGATVVPVAGAGHAPMLERPDETAQAVVPFLEGVRDAARGT